jgi:hypothetical protein
LLNLAFGGVILLAAVALAQPAGAQSTTQPAAATPNATDATRRAVDQNLGLSVRRQLERSKAVQADIDQQTGTDKARKPERTPAAGDRKNGNASQ